MADRDPRIIGMRIARRRHQLDWSQVELARRLSVSPSTVANWERGASYPKKKFGKVEQVLGIRLDDGPEPELPSPEELQRLREHIREVLGERDAIVQDAVGRVMSGEPPPTGGRGEGSAGASSASGYR